MSADRRTTTRVLGIDTSLRSTGVGVVERRGSQFRCVAFSVIRSTRTVPLSQCLVRLSEGLRETVRAHEPQTASIEGAFYSHNARTAMTLGQARGVAIATCAGLGLSVYEYAPRRVKQAVVGFGGADKSQVQKMVVSLLGLDETPPEDASDALALAICHLQGRSSYAPLTTEPI